MHMQDDILVLMKFDNYHIIVLICFKWLAQSIAGKPVLVHKFDHSLKQLLHMCVKEVVYTSLLLHQLIIDARC